MENEKLNCLHEPGNAFDRFAIKTADEKEETVLLDRGFTLYCKLSTLITTLYRCSPRVQGRLLKHSLFQ